MNIVLKALTIGAIVLVSNAAHAEERLKLKIATEGAFPPWNSVSPSGEIVGFDIDVGKALCERANADCEFVTQAWDGIIPGLNVGKYDAIMAGMSITEKRKEVIAFSEPYALTTNYFVVAKASGMPTLANGAKVNLSDPAGIGAGALEILKENLRRKIIGVQGSTNAELFAREFLGATVEVRTYDTQDNLNLDLAAGRIDAGLADYSAWQAFLERDGGRTVELYGPGISGGVFGPGIGIGVQRTSSDLVRRLNEAIRSIKKNGTLEELSFRWFGADVSPE